MKWGQRYRALVRWSIWYWQQRRRAADLALRQDPPISAADGANGAPQEDAAVDAERSVLAALLQAGKRELP